VPIPKKFGETRVLGIPTASDRIAQTVVKKALEPLLDPIFDKDFKDVQSCIAWMEQLLWPFLSIRARTHLV